MHEESKPKQRKNSSASQDEAVSKHESTEKVSDLNTAD